MGEGGEEASVHRFVGGAKTFLTFFATAVIWSCTIEPSTSQVPLKPYRFCLVFFFKDFCLLVVGDGGRQRYSKTVKSFHAPRASEMSLAST